ncbi:MAG: TCR/Tet family MFS transporter [Cytophagales bacterium]|nr:TCR/Tet family MFS transporter [Armatimonadota bacterium]
MRTQAPETPVINPPPDDTPAESGKPNVRSVRRPTAGLAFIFITLLIDVLGFGLIIPVLPKLVAGLAGGGPEVGAHVFGLLMAVFGLMQFLFSPILGGLSDRFGRRPVLLLSLLVSGLDYILMALAPSLSWLFAGRVLAGITGASFTAASAYIADISPPEKRAQNFGLIGAAFGVGFVLGPAVGGLLGSISPRAPFWAAAALSLLNGLYGFFILPESLSKENRRAFTWRSANPIGGLSILLRYRWVTVMAGSILLLALAQQSLQSTWVLYTTYRFEWSELDNGLSLALVGLASGLVQVLLVKALVDRIGERRAILWGLICNIAGFTGFALATRGWMMLPVILFWSLSGVAGPTTQSLISKQYGADEQGAVQGALASVQSLMGVAGPIIATWVFGYFTSAAAPVRIPGASFFLGAILVAGAAVLAARALRLGAGAVMAQPITPGADASSTASR